MIAIPGKASASDNTALSVHFSLQDANSSRYRDISNSLNMPPPLSQKENSKIRQGATAAQTRILTTAPTDLDAATYKSFALHYDELRPSSSRDDGDGSAADTLLSGGNSNVSQQRALDTMSTDCSDPVPLGYTFFPLVDRYGSSIVVASCCQTQSVVLLVTSLIISSSFYLSMKCWE